MGLLDKIKPTSKVGKGASVNAFYLQFPDLEGSPTFELEETLTVGSEVGDVVLDADGIAPRHCTFYLNQDVVSIMDHGGQEGTFIGKKQIDSGRMIILLPNDKLTLGEVKAKIVQEAKTVPIEPAFKPMEYSQEDPLEEEDFEEDTEEHKVVKEKTQIKLSKVFKKLTQIKNLGKDVFKVKIEKGSGQSSNGFLRTMAVIFDFLIAGIILTIISPLQDITALIEQVIPLILEGVAFTTSQLQELSGVDLVAKVKLLMQQYPVLKTLWEDVVEFYQNPNNKLVWQVLSLFAILRLAGTLIFGVSIGQLFAGIRNMGNAIVGRVMGVVREFIGFFTGPFLIFDSLTLVNRPSLKELLTFTRVETPSAGKAWISSLLALVLLTSIYIAAPLFRGLEPLEPYQFTDALKPNPAQQENEVRPYFSKNFGLTFTKEISGNLIPSYSIVATQDKKVAHIQVAVLTESDQIKIRPYRDFSWAELLKTALNLNLLAHDKFSAVYNVIHAAGNENANFKPALSEYTAYSSGVVALTNTAFNLGVSNIVTYLKQFGPFVKTFADYRQQFMDLMPADTRLQMVTNAADSAVFVSSSLNGKFYVIPITFPQGKVFEVDSKLLRPDQLQNLLQKIYFLNPDKPKALKANPEFNMLAFVDTIYDGLEGREKPQNLQYAYEWLFMKLKNAMANPDEKVIKAWKGSIKKLIQLLQTVKLDKNPEKPAWNKFYRNLNDLLKALEDNDYNFFGITAGKLT